MAALAATGIAAKMASSPPAATPPAEPEPPPGSGYRLTEHIQKYYRTTKI
ncbi:formate dehydrogenase [Pseudoduganella sp. S-14]